MKKIIRKGRLRAFSLLLGLCIMLFSNCQTIPSTAKAVHDFDVDRYLGTWYEIARIDFKYEKDLIYTTATYSKNEDGSISVLNRGFNKVKDEWKEAEGKAKFVDKTDEAKLKVSFFGPFYAGYNVVALDDEYKYALVAGKNLDYLWILSREKEIPESVKQNYLNVARGIGYDVSRLLWIKQQ